MLVFEEKTGVPREKPLGARKKTNNKLNAHTTPGPGIEPRTHWWEASALTTAPSLLPNPGAHDKSARQKNAKRDNTTPHLIYTLV